MMFWTTTLKVSAARNNSFSAWFREQTHESNAHIQSKRSSNSFGNTDFEAFYFSLHLTNKTNPGVFLRLTSSSRIMYSI